MKRRSKYSQVWVKVAIGSGILLGIMLLTQTIATYFFVYDKIVHEEAAQEVERKEAALIRAAIAAGVSDVHQLEPVIHAIRKESAKQVAWIRIIDIDSNVIAQTGNALTKVPTGDLLRRQLARHQSNSEIVQSDRGEVLVALSRMRFFRPPPERRQSFDARTAPPPPREAPYFTQIGIYVEGVTVHLGALRQNLIVGCLAAVALLSSTLMIGFLFNRYIRARKLEQQVELARSVQTDLLPSSESKRLLEDVEFAAAFFPAATVGGDFYDVFSADNGLISIVLGDVAGKGISAALLMGVLHGAIRSMNCMRAASDQEQGSRWLNRFLCEKTARERFVSLFWAYYLPETGVLRYVNAGHLPPLLIRAAGSGLPALERLESGGPVLGVLPAATYHSGMVQVEAGDVLVVYSDGVCEATNLRDEEFGEQRIAETVQRHIDGSPQSICDAILAEVDEFLGKLKAHDDQTLLVVRLAPTAKTRAESMRNSESLVVD